MDVTSLSIARVLELGVPITWREAGAVVFESVYHAQQLGGTRTEPLAPHSLLITRGGDVILTEDAQRAHPEAIAALAADLVRACTDPGDLGAALHAGQLLPFLEALGDDTTWKRRRAQIATLALRALAAQADQAHAGAAVAPRTTGGAAASQFTRRAPRSRHVEPSPRRYQRLAPLPPAVPGRRISVRAVVFTAIAISAGAAGFGLWQAAARTPASPASSGSARPTAGLVPVVATLPAPEPPSMAPTATTDLGRTAP